MWSVGCIFYKLLTKRALFSYTLTSSLDLESFLNIFDVMGIPKCYPTSKQEDKYMYCADFSFDKMANIIAEYHVNDVKNILYNTGIPDNIKSMSKRRQEFEYRYEKNHNSAFAKKMKPIFKKCSKRHKKNITINKKRLAKELEFYYSNKHFNRRKKELISRINNVVGRSGVNLVLGLLAFDPNLRLNATEALDHVFFETLK